MSYYEVECPEKSLTQFKLDDRHSTIKSDLSTILRESKNTTISNKIKSSKDPNKKRKAKDEEKSKSRSKSKKKEKNHKRKDKSRSVSKSRDHSYSQELSENSFLRSSVSKSKSTFPASA